MQKFLVRSLFLVLLLSGAESRKLSLPNSILQ